MPEAGSVMASARRKVGTSSRQVAVGVVSSDLVLETTNLAMAG